MLWADYGSRPIQDIIWSAAKALIENWHWGGEGGGPHSQFQSLKIRGGALGVPRHFLHTALYNWTLHRIGLDQEYLYQYLISIWCVQRQQFHINKCVPKYPFLQYSNMQPHVSIHLERSQLPRGKQIFCIELILLTYSYFLPWLGLLVFLEWALFCKRKDNDEEILK